MQDEIQDASSKSSLPIGPAEMVDLILHLNLSPGDTVAMTAAVRDLHLAHPGKFRTDVRTTASAIWQNNPYITPLKDDDPGIRHIEMHYELINSSNEGAYHFLHAMLFQLEHDLDIRIPMTKLKGEIYLSDEEKNWTSQVNTSPISWRHDFWIIMAGGKYDIECKWWDPARYQEVVDTFAGCIKFVQCGENGHWHKPLDNVINLVGKTTIRQFIRLVYHASGILCPITFAMHLAVAVPTKPDRLKNRPCVVIAGGREPAQWAAYPHHRFLNVNGSLPCCDQGGCWKGKCQIGMKDGNACFYPIKMPSGTTIAKCMEMIEVDDVCRAIDQYHRGSACQYLTNGPA